MSGRPVNRWLARQPGKQTNPVLDQARRATPDQDKPGKPTWTRRPGQYVSNQPASGFTRPTAIGSAIRQLGSPTGEDDGEDDPAWQHDRRTCKHGSETRFDDDT